jgi:hypothetical protein
VQLILTSGLEFLRDVIDLVWYTTFFGLPSENPYYHLCHFKFWCSYRTMLDMTLDTIK